jgi:hypothetical protein
MSSEKENAKVDTGHYELIYESPKIKDVQQEIRHQNEKLYVEGKSIAK